MRPIRFTYDNVEYEVDSYAYHLDRIVLPDGRLLQAQGWFESIPPQPDGLCEINHDLPKDDLESIAEQFYAVVATRV